MPRRAQPTGPPHPAEHIENTLPDPNPCTPRQILAWSYGRDHITRDYEDRSQNDISAMEVEYQREVDVPVTCGWSSCSHPEGRLYFYRAPRELETVAGLTNSVLFSEDILKRADAAFDRVKQKLPQSSCQNDVEHRNVLDTIGITLIVLDIREGGDYYYCVRWKSRRVFWPERTKFGLSSGKGIQVFDLSHLASRNEEFFWSHAVTFPKYGGAYAPITEMKEVLNFAYVDTLTSETSTVSFDKETLVSMIGAVANLTENSYSEYNVWIVARIMQTFCRSRFLNYYGQPDAILNWGDTVTGMESNTRPSTLFWIISLLLLGWPIVYFRDMRGIWVNGNTQFLRGQKFIAATRADWEGSTIPATMPLTANVSLLAIQSLDNSSGTSNRSLVQIASYVSLLLSLFNYIACQVLLRQHRKITNSTADMYFLRPSKDPIRLQIMAIVFSLPQGLFSWSMLAFLVAVCWVFFHLTSAVTWGLLCGSLSLLCIIILFMFLWVHFQQRSATRLVEVGSSV